MRQLFGLAPWKSSLNVAWSLWFDYAHVRTVVTKRCVDAAGQPVPWYTYPAIEYLKQLDFSDRTVFEYGAGYSTLFWAARARRVVSVDDDTAWFEQIRLRIPPHCELMLVSDLAAYPDAIRRTGERFDVVVVDGAARGHTRLKCSKLAVEHLALGGMIILDNSDWLPESARLLRDAGLIEVDMTGFAPISSVSQTTSFFLERGFAFRPLHARQPMPGPGAADKIWEHPVPTEPPLVTCGDDTFGGVVRNEPVTFSTAAGDRMFRIVVAESRQTGRRFAALLDMQRDRVLLVSSEGLTAPPRVEADIDRLTRLPWHEFVARVNRHDQRRYDLEQHRDVQHT